MGVSWVWMPARATGGHRAIGHPTHVPHSERSEEPAVCNQLISFRSRFLTQPVLSASEGLEMRPRQIEDANFNSPLTRQYGSAPEIVYLHSPVMVDNSVGRIVVDAE